MELIDWAAMAVIIYIGLTILSRAILIGLYGYFIREWFKSESSSKSSLSSEHNSPPTYDW